MFFLVFKYHSDTPKQSKRIACKYQKIHRSSSRQCDDEAKKKGLMVNGEDFPVRKPLPIRNRLCYYYQHHQTQHFYVITLRPLKSKVR